MSELSSALTVTTLLHVLIVLVFGARIIMMRSAPGVAFAWLLLIIMLPLVGAVLYLLIGERRIGPERARRLDSLSATLNPGGGVPGERLTDVDWSRNPQAAAGLDRLGTTLCGCATVAGSEITLYSESEEAMQAVARDIDDAETGVSMAFYIWNEGGSADEVLESVIRAADRGVACRILVDAIGGRPWLRGPQPPRLRAAGVQVEPALPVGFVRSFFGGAGLRMHRKVVVVDDKVAWTGSMNLADPKVFKHGAGVGEWVDAFARLRGAVVAPLGTTVLGDWMLETGTPLEELVQSTGLDTVQPRGSADIQVIPSGPGETGDGLLQMLLALVGSAREELVLTTPYLVPDESMIRALRGAAGRGVKVTVIVPERVDSVLTRHASRSFFGDLMDAGVEIFLYRKGLLHTKSIVVDGGISMFGSVNLDMRSTWINYEIALFVYDSEFSERLRELQQTYLSDSRRLDPGAWAARPIRRQFLENTIRLVSPIL
jgi:cardiolipin synthase